MDEAYFKAKADNGKARWELLPWAPVAAVVGVLTYGAQKYSADSWRGVPDAKKRYRAALLRHLVAWFRGEEVDQESGLRHVDHALCNLVFLWELHYSEESAAPWWTIPGEPWRHPYVGNCAHAPVEGDPEGCDGHGTFVFGNGDREACTWCTEERYWQ